MNILKSKTVYMSSEYFMLMIGFKHYNLGIQFQDHGIRLMLIWWHVCIHYRWAK